MSEAFWSPSGMYVVVSQQIGASTWLVRVYNFATWKHRRDEYSTEKEARDRADLWRI